MLSDQITCNPNAMNKAPTLSPDPDDKNLADPTLAVVADVNQLDLEISGTRWSIRSSSPDK